jgi:hypothetical protein
MKWIILTGELAGFLSSLLLAYGFWRIRGTITWRNDDPGYERSRIFRECAIIGGFLTLAGSFAIQAWSTLCPSN